MSLVVRFDRPAAAGIVLVMACAALATAADKPARASAGAAPAPILRPAGTLSTADFSTDPGAPGHGNAAIFEVDPGAYRSLRDSGATRLHLAVPITAHLSAAVELTRFDIFGDEARIVVADDRGEHDAPRPDVLLWRGGVSGDPASRVFLALDPRGADGYITVSRDFADRQFGDPQATTFIISSVPAHRDDLPGAGRSLAFDARLLESGGQALGEPLCAGVLEAPGAAPVPAFTGDSRPLRGTTPPCRRFFAAVDCDTEFTTARFAGNTTLSAAYATKLMGATSEIYLRDFQAVLKLNFLRTWTGTSPYNAATSGAQLSQFVTYWRANRPPVLHNFAVLMSSRALGGGVAYRSQLCSTNWGFGFMGSLNGTFPYPIRDNSSSNWDLTVTAHEIGHIFSSGHTHDVNSYNPIIDGCGLDYLDPPQTKDCTVAQQRQGTIMSYCHTCSGGQSNLRMTFGPRPSAQIRSYIEGGAANCGDAPVSISITSQPSPDSACRGGVATLSVTAAGTDAVYQWRRGTTALVDGPTGFGSTISGASSRTLTITGVQPGDVNASYTCFITNLCTAATTSPVQVSLCTGDFNCSGEPTVQDVFDFLAAYFAALPSADINGQGGLSVQDLFTFLESYFSGCD